MRHKTAAAAVVLPELEYDQWRDEIAGPPIGRRKTAARKIAKRYNPKNFVLTHASLITSVDVEGAPATKGRFKDFHVTPDTEQFANANHDAWERRLLLASYSTLVGVPNYVEHAAVPSIQRGFVLDAVAREITVKKTASSLIKTAMVDVLLATNKKFGPLVDDILSKKLNSLSMGCALKYAICTKCGNEAETEDDLCDDIKYAKGAYFMDKNGTRRKIVELSGHHTEPESNVFTEVSWVSIPAFTTATVHNILAPKASEMAKLSRKIELANRILRYRERRTAELKEMRRVAASAGMPEAVVERHRRGGIIVL